MFPKLAYTSASDWLHDCREQVCMCSTVHVSVCVCNTLIHQQRVTEGTQRQQKEG